MRASRKFNSDKNLELKSSLNVGGSTTSGSLWLMPMTVIGLDFPLQSMPTPRRMTHYTVKDLNLSNSVRFWAT
jgi:hypothetical protein